MLHGFSTLSGDAFDLLRLYTHSIDPEVAMGAYAALTKFADPRDLMSLCDYVNEAGGTTAASAVGYYNFASIVDISEPNARQALECLARAPKPGLNIYAMEAIRRIRAPESVPELIKHLDDSDSMMAYLAVITLSEIVHRPDEPGPGVPAFEQDKSRYILSWKRWWLEKGSGLYAKGAIQ
jgi:hypothetical protein